jgi:broad specificity phosphatase PhoE
MNFYLVRHGQSELNAAGIRHGCEVDPPLTDLGVRQAKMAGGELYRLCDAPPVILSSPATRARQTADLIAQMTVGDHHPGISALDERRYDTVIQAWAETCAQAAERAWNVMQSVNARMQATTIVVVTHAGVIKGLTSSGVTPPNGSVTAFGEWAFESSAFLTCGPS